MIIDLLRHGEAKGGSLYRGNLLDHPLTKKGWGDMQKATHGKNWDLIATSPMLRCKSFAEHLSATKNTEIQVFDDFKEIGFGDWQGLNVQQIGQKTVNQFKQNPIINRPNNAEDLFGFQARVLSVLDKIKQRKSAKSVLIISHAGVIRIIKSHLLNLPIEKMFTIDIICASCESLNFD